MGEIDRERVVEQFKFYTKYAEEKYFEKIPAEKIVKKLLPNEKEKLEETDIKRVLDAYFHMFELRKRGRLNKALHETHIANNYQAILYDIKNSDITYEEMKDNVSWSISMFFYNKNNKDKDPNVEVLKENESVKSKNKTFSKRILFYLKQDSDQKRNSAAELMNHIFFRSLTKEREVPSNIKGHYDQIYFTKIKHD